MLDNLKSLLSAVSSGTKTDVNPKKTYQYKPELQSSFEQKFANNLGKPVSETLDKHSASLRLTNPNYQGLRAPTVDSPAYSSIADRISQIMGGNTNLPKLMSQTPSTPAMSAEDRINAFAAKAPTWLKNTGNFAADLTFRPLTRLAASGFLTDPANKGIAPDNGRYKANDPLMRLLLGDREVASFPNQAKDNSNWFQEMGANPDLASKLGTGGMVLGSVLDATGFSKANGVKQTIEKALVAHSDDAVNALWKSKTALEKLRYLSNYGDDLIKKGFSREDINKLSAKTGAWLIENGITPKSFAEITKSESDNKNLWQSFVPVMKEWIGSRQAAKFEGVVKSDAFKRLDVLGTQAFDLIQGAEHRTALNSVRNYFDDAYQRLANSGIKIGYIQDYIPQMWKQSDGEVEMALGRRLSKNTPFSLERIIKDYREGISAGLTPKYNKLSDVIGAYETSIQKTLADRKFFDWLKSNKVIMTASDIAKVSKEKRGLFKDWVSISADRFGTTSGTDQVFKASPDIAGAIDNYLTDFGSNASSKYGTFQKALKTGAGINTQIKNWLLSSGIPGTGANSFGYMTVKRAMLAAKNPIKAGKEAIEMVIKPSVAQNYIDTNMAKLPDAVKHGLVLSVEDHEFFAPLETQYKNILSKSYGVVANKLDTWFSKPLFSKVLPAIKLKQYDEYLKIYLEQGLDSTQAKQLAAETTNNVFGGLNLDMLMKDKGWQVVFRNAFLAPDLYQSQINVGKGLVKTVFKPGSNEAKAYGVYMRNMFLSRLVSEVENKVLSGHWQFQNDSGNKSNIETNLFLDDGHRFVLKGTGLDVSKIPLDIVDAVANGDVNVGGRIIRNRLSPLLGMGIGQATNTDYKGSPIYYPDATPGEQLGSRAIEASKLLLPSQVAESAKFATGKQGATETALRLIEAPVYLQGGPKTKADETKVKLMQSGGATGEDIYSQLEAGRSYNQPKKLSEKEKIANLQAGKPVDTATNFWGKPGKVSGVQDATTGTNEGNTGTGSLLNKYAQEEKSKADKKAKVKLIYENLSSDDQIRTALANEGISEKEAVTLMALDLATPQRAEYLQSIITTTTSREEYVKTLAEMMREKLLTTAVISEWEDTDIVSAETAKELRAMLKYINNPTAKSGSGSTKTLQQKVDSMPASLKLKIPTPTVGKTIKAPTLKLPSMNLPTPEFSKRTKTRIKDIAIPQVNYKPVIKKLPGQN